MGICNLSDIIHSCISNNIPYMIKIRGYYFSQINLFANVDYVKQMLHVICYNAHIKHMILHTKERGVAHTPPPF